MKNHILGALAISLITHCFALNTCKAQAPQGIPYQAIARNASGVAIANTAVKVRFSIRDSIATGPVRYQETHSPTTSALGLFSVNVGMGTVVSGTFSGINWGKNAKFLRVELNTTGGTTFTDLGTTQMMSVPYALFAGQVSNQPLVESNSRFFTMVSSLSPNVPIYYLTGAISYCLNLSESGFSDWRLPSLDEWLKYSEQNGVPLYKGWTTTLSGDGNFFTIYDENNGPQPLSAGSIFSVRYSNLQPPIYSINCVR